ncbi:hypothetical protein NAT51_16600 [Flavobacterium amniphilum]|nr:hypothetical protein [Flavobacterium amniphilum]MCL9807156.1 hypothetical protein [Flavobacterium amniphilum]
MSVSVGSVLCANRFLIQLIMETKLIELNGLQKKDTVTAEFFPFVN